MPNLAGRKEVTDFFNMYRGRKKKLIFDTPNFRVIEVGNLLYIQLIPLMGSSIIFLEHERGTEIVVTNNKNNILHQTIHPFISPSMIGGLGSLIPDSKKEHYKKLLLEHFNIEIYDEKAYKALNSVDKLYYVNKTWDLTHTLVYDILR